MNLLPRWLYLLLVVLMLWVPEGSCSGVNVTNITLGTVAEDAPPEQRAAKVEAFWNDSSAVLRWTTFLVTLNLGLGLINVLPLLPLDGAHLACALFKGIVGVQVPVSWQILISVVELVVLMLWLAAMGGAMERPFSF